MSENNFMKRLSLSDRILFCASALYVVAFLFLANTTRIDGLEITMLVLAIIAIGVLVARAVTAALDEFSLYFDIGLVVIAAFIAVRYVVEFLTDSRYLVTLLLFAATAGFAVVCVMMIRKFLRRGSVTAPQSDSDESPDET